LWDVEDGEEDAETRDGDLTTHRRRTIRLAVGSPSLRESRCGLVHQIAHALDRTEARLVGHRSDDERADDVSGDRDRKDHRPPALHEPLEGRGAVGVAQWGHDLVKAHRADHSSLSARARDGVIAVGELDGETAD